MMKRFFLFGAALAAVLALAGCASPPAPFVPTAPTQFEGRWFAAHIEELGSMATALRSIPTGLNFEGDRVSMMLTSELGQNVLFFSRNPFTYTDTEIVIESGSEPWVFQYYFEAGMLVTSEGRTGTIIWARN